MPRVTPLRVRMTVLAAALCSLAPAVCAALDFHQGFDEGPPTWNVQCDVEACRVAIRKRQATVRWKGAGAEFIRLTGVKPSSTAILEYPVPASRVIDELTASVWIRASQPGITLALRLVFPHQRDPQTRQPLTIDLEGSSYTDPGAWQQLTCRTADRTVASRIRLLREQLRSDVSLQDMFVDQVRLIVTVPRGTTDIVLDDLQMGPLVAPPQDLLIQPVSVETASMPSVEMRLDRLLIGGRPFFPRFVPHHGEPVEILAGMQFNPVWVPDYKDRALLEELRVAGLYGMAAPPIAADPGGDLLNPRDAGLPPFTAEADPILFWMLGTGITPAERTRLAGWREQVLAADRRLNRPLMADVTGSERTYSRIVPMLGLTHPVLHSSFGFRPYRNWLLDRHKVVRPGSFLWTWIQTEPTAQASAARAGGSTSPLVVEPEQIRLQTYAALAGGCRGVGFWKSNRLDDDGPGALERRLILQQLNDELHLLEPWLATGTLLAQTPLLRPSERAAQATAALPFMSQKPSAAKTPAKKPANSKTPPAPVLPSGELEAAILRTDAGLLLLPVWYGKDAQFVPGQMAANDVTIVVPGVDESAAAWMVTTTAITHVERKRIAGGLQLTLPKFDQTAAIIISSDLSIRDQLRQRMEPIRERSARTCLELAEAKLARVREVDQQLTALQVGQPDAQRILDRAQGQIELSRGSFFRQDFHRAREYADDACQLLRILQKAHWDHAVERLASPVSSPHTLCFQTLPDHWRMVARFGRAPLTPEANLLRSGNFEDADTIFAEGWQHAQEPVEGVRATAELYRLQERGNYCLRLVAVPAAGHEAPSQIAVAPITVTTPPMTVRSGQIIHIGGWVRLVTDVMGSLDGVVLYDSLGGADQAIRWHKRGEWQRFELIREIPASGELTISMALHGLGEVQFDDLRVIPVTPVSESETARREPASRTGLGLDRLPRVPGLLPLRREE